MKQSFKIFNFLPLFLFLLMFAVGCSKNNEDKKEFNEDIEVEQRQYQLLNFVQEMTACEAANLTFYVDDCFAGTDYDGLIQTAMQHYSDAPLNLNWKETNDAAEAHLVFECQSGNCGTGVASPPENVEETLPAMFPPGSVDPNVQTHFPSGGSIGGVIRLSTDWQYCICDPEELDPCFFMATVLHEVAHSLGLMHNQTAFPNQHIPGTPTGADPNSVINPTLYHIANGTFCDRPCQLGAYDIVALQTLYPEVVIEGPEDLCLGERGDFCIDYKSSGDKVDWLVNGQSVNYGTPIIGKDSCFGVMFPSPGVYNVTAIITDGDCEYELETTVEVHVPPSEHCVYTPDGPSHG